MNRRQAVCALGALALHAASLRAARAQQRPRKVAILLPGSRGDEGGTEAFVAAMRRLGWVEGKTVTYQRFFSNASRGAADALAVTIAAEQPDLVYAYNVGLTRSMLKASATLPVVFTAGADPVVAGVVESLRMPGKNATGVFQMSGDTLGKRFELAREAFPRANRIGVLLDRSTMDYASYQQEVNALPKRNDFSLVEAQLNSVEALPGVLERFRHAAVPGFLTPPSFPLLARRAEVVRASLAAGLAPIGHRTEFAESGALFSYGGDLRELQHRAADLADRVLRGARPAQTPVERSTKFELVVNLATAAKLGIQLPQGFLLRADRVIQ